MEYSGRRILFRAVSLIPNLGSLRLLQEPSGVLNLEKEQANEEDEQEAPAASSRSSLASGDDPKLTASGCRPLLLLVTWLSSLAAEVEMSMVPQMASFERKRKPLMLVVKDYLVPAAAGCPSPGSALQ